MSEHDASCGKIRTWATAGGNMVRLSHMSNNHLLNCIRWLLEDEDLSLKKDGFTIREWIEAMSEELYSRSEENIYHGESS